MPNASSLRKQSLLTRRGAMICNLSAPYLAIAVTMYLMASVGFHTCQELYPKKLQKFNARKHM